MKLFLTKHIGYLTHLPQFWISLLWNIFIFSRALGEGVPSPPLILFVIFVFIITIKNLPTIEGFNKTISIFILYIFLSLVIISPPDIFQSYNRFWYFIALLIVTSALVQGKTIREFRSTSLTLILNLSTIVTLISFICYFLGINLVIREYNDADSYLENPNIFAGITSHSMILGFVSMVSLIYTTYISLKNKSIYCWMGVAICFITCLFSASRGALIAGIIGFLYLITINSPQKINILKRIFLIGLALILSFPIWETHTSRVLKKQEMRENSGMFDSRTEKVNARLNEFQDSPIIGIGFSVINTNYDRIKASGAIEPGSSWLGVLSMTGIIGFILFLTIIIRSWWIVHCRKLYLHESLIIVLSIHMMVEGYVFFAGSLQCVILWTILGSSFDYFKFKTPITN